MSILKSLQPLLEKQKKWTKDLKVEEVLEEDYDKDTIDIITHLEKLRYNLEKLGDGESIEKINLILNKYDKKKPLEGEEDSEEISEEESYYSRQMTSLDPRDTIKIKMMDDKHETKWMDLNNESIVNLETFLKTYKAILP